MPANAKPTRDNSKSNARRWRLPIGLSLMVALGLVGIALWQAWPEHLRFYTDGQGLRVDAQSARVRDVLWRDPEALPPSINNEGDDYEPDVDENEGVLYFVRGKPGEDANIHTSNRTTGGWSESSAIETINTEYDDLGPRVTSDGLSLYFYSDRPGGFGGYDLWVAHRSSRESAFDKPINLGPNVNTSWDEYSPALAPTADAVYFSSNRPVGEIETEPKPRWSATLRENRRRTGYDLYVAPMTGAGYGAATRLDAINSPTDEGTPAVSPTGDFLYFSSNRSGGAGGFDLYRVRINESALGTIEPLGPSVNGPADELDPILSMEGFELHFSSNRATDVADVSPGEPTYDIYRTTSREVYVASETLQAGLDWGVLMGILGPGLLALLLLLLLLLLARMLTNSAWRGRLSLIMRCLLASVFVHLLLLTLFMFWQVTTTLTGLFDRKGGVRVALASPVGNASLTAQIRGGFADAVMPTVQAANKPRTFEHTVQPVRLATSQAQMPRVEVSQLPSESQTQRLPDARPPLHASPATSVMPVDNNSKQPQAIALNVPEVSPAEQTTEQHIELPTTQSSPVAVRRDVATAMPSLANAPIELTPVRLASHVLQSVHSPTQSIRDAAVPKDGSRQMAFEPIRTRQEHHVRIALPQPNAARLVDNEHEQSLPIVLETRADRPALAATSQIRAPSMSAAMDSMPLTPRTELSPRTNAVDEAKLRLTDAPAASRPPMKQVSLGVTPGQPAPKITIPSNEPIAAKTEREFRIVPIPIPHQGEQPKLDLTVADTPQVDDSESSLDLQKPVALRLPDAATDSPPIQVSEVTIAPRPGTRAINLPRIGTPELVLSLPVPSAPAINAIGGQVTDAHTGDPLVGAVVRLDLNDDAAETATTDDTGGYALQVGSVPEHFAISASFDGYVPASVNIPQEAVRDRALTVNFRLRRIDLSTVAIEAVPDVHHLGDDRFSGSVNSQFQKRSEGGRYVAEFELSESQVSPHMTQCELSMLTRGVQMPHPIYLNGQPTHLHLTPSPRNGSFGEFRAEVPIELLRKGTNTFAIRARSRGNDIDDFEFVNVQLHLAP